MGASDAVVMAAVATASLLASLRRRSGDSAVEDEHDPHPEVTEEITKLIRERLASDPQGASTLTAVEEDPKDPERQQLLQDTLVDVVVMDDVFAGKLASLAAKAEGLDAELGAHGKLQAGVAAAHAEETYAAGQARLVQRFRIDPDRAPVRGFPGLTVAATSPQTTAGSDFSIFVLVQNPFDVPITIYQVQTHIPVELIDVNRLRAKSANLATSDSNSREGKAAKLTAWGRLQRRRQLRHEHPGVAVAVGTEFSPEEAGQLSRCHDA